VREEEEEGEVRTKEEISKMQRENAQIQVTRSLAVFHSY
jgi:hypothetical protein